MAALVSSPEWRKSFTARSYRSSECRRTSTALHANTRPTPNAAPSTKNCSTTNNSALSLALDYNGLGRVTGQTGGTSFGGGAGGAFSGTPGIFRLLNQALGDQGGWLLALAIVGGLSLLVAAVTGRRRTLR